MNEKFLIRSAQAGLLALSAMVGTQANAGLVMDIAGGFVCDDVSSPNGQDILECTTPSADSGPANAPADTYDHIEWTDTDDPKSALDIQLFNNIQLDDGVQGSAFEIVTQTNNVIDGQVSWNLDVATEIVFRDHTDLIELYRQTAIVNLDFLETTNGGGCVAGNPLGSTCDDVYIATFPPEFLGPIEFMDDDFFYSVQFLISADVGTFVCAPGDQAANSECPGGADSNLAALNLDQIAIYAAEVDMSVISFSALATKTPKVPEPSSLSLLALGLSGGIAASALRRRRQRS